MSRPADCPVWCDYGPDGEVREHKGCVIVFLAKGWGGIIPAGSFMVSWYPAFCVHATFAEALEFAVEREFEEIEFALTTWPKGER